MNWFMVEPISAETLMQAGLPYLEIFCGLVAIVAVLMFAVVLLHTLLGVRSRDPHLELHQFGDAKRPAHLVRTALSPSRGRGWLPIR